MLDFRAQLRSYVDETIERIDADDVVASVSNRSFDPAQRSMFRQPAVAFAAALGIVLAVVGGLTWLVRDNAAGPAADPTIPTTATHAPPDEIEGLRWRPISAPGVERVSAARDIRVVQSDGDHAQKPHGPRSQSTYPVATIPVPSETRSTQVTPSRASTSTSVQSSPSGDHQTIASAWPTK